MILCFIILIFIFALICFHYGKNKISESNSYYIGDKVIGLTARKGYDKFFLSTVIVGIKRVGKFNGFAKTDPSGFIRIYDDNYTCLGSISIEKKIYNYILENNNKVHAYGFIGSDSGGIYGKVCIETNKTIITKRNKPYNTDYIENSNTVNIVIDEPIIYKSSGIKWSEIKGLAYADLNENHLGKFYGYVKTEKDNPYDKYAIAIYNEKEKRLGYISKGNECLFNSLEAIGGVENVWGFIRNVYYEYNDTNKLYGEVFIPIKCSKAKIEKAKLEFKNKKIRRHINY